ncbi:MAG TPA: FAD-dependent oxidoreductase [Burkholderiaceae bacterium]|nr:FAD-dependent oxidoreductase [Burkholderiaceae bacterium]
MTALPAVDVAVVGGGVVGCACAWTAAQAGLDVALFEARDIGGGATAAAMGHLVMLDDDPAELALARLSMHAWSRWPGWSRVAHRQAGTLWLAEDDAQQHAAQRRVARLRAADWDAEWLDAAALRVVEPRLAPDLVGALWVPRDEIADGPELARALASDLQSAGGSVHAGCGVDGVTADGLRLSDGRGVPARHVLLAAGVDSVALWPGAARLGLRPRHGQLLITDRYPGWVRHALVEMGYADSAHGCATESVAFNAQPRPSGQILVGSSRREGAATSRVDPALLSRMLRRAERFLPRLGELRALRTWAGCRPATADGRPLIGALPQDVRPGGTRTWVATGHEGLGLTTAMGTAQLWLDLLLERPPSIDPAPYAPVPARAQARRETAEEGVA